MASGSSSGWFIAAAPAGRAAASARSLAGQRLPAQGHPLAGGRSRRSVAVHGRRVLLRGPHVYGRHGVLLLVPANAAAQPRTLIKLLRRRPNPGAVDVLPALEAGGEDAVGVLEGCLEHVMEVLDLLST